MKRFAAGIALLIGLANVACNHVYKKYDEESFGALNWVNGQEISFNPKIENIETSYKLKLGIRHMYGLEMSSIKFNMNITAPSGKETNMDYTINIKDSTGEYIGSCVGDICDLESTVEEYIHFDELGEYNIIITHKEQVDRIRGVLAVGLVVDEIN